MPAARPVEDEDVSEDDEDVQDDDEVSDSEAARKQSKKRKTPSFIDDAAEEDDEEEEEEENRGKRHKKRNIFVDDIAAVDEDEEEEEDEDEEEGWMEKDELPSAQEQMGLYHRQQNRKDDNDISLEELQNYVKQRFETPSQRYAEVGHEQASEVGQQGLQPTPQDPKLWLVECKTGSEREAVISLMQKCMDLASKGAPLAIKSVFTQDHLKGYLYVEAHKESHVTDATRGLRIIYHSKGARLVPLKEMVSAIYVNQQAKSQLEPDSWARVRAGQYKSDLCKVMSVDYSKGVAEVKLVPRIDYAEMAKRQQEGGRAPPFGGHRAGKARVKARAFSRAEAQRHRLMVEERRSQQAASGFCYYLGSNTSNRYEDGYLIREFPIKSLHVEEATPPVDELQSFNQVAQASQEAAEPGNEIAALVQTMGSEDTAATTFKEGDKVLVTEGDLKNLDGTIVSVTDEGKLMVKASMAELAGNAPLTIEAQHVVKFFQAGDSVSVTAGAYIGRKGTVVKVKGRICYIFDEASQQEFEVFARDLSATAAKVLPGADKFGDYELHDLVELDQQTAGVLVQADAETCQVLTNRNAMTPDTPEIRTATLQDIKRKLFCPRTMSAPDNAGSPVNVGDMVDLVRTDPSKPEVGGTVKFIQRGALWLLVKEKIGSDTGGFVCVDSRKTQLRGGRQAGVPRGAASIAAGFKSPAPWATPARNAFASSSMTMASPRPFDSGPSYRGAAGVMGGYKGAAAASRGPTAFSGAVKSRREDHLIGKSIHIAKGPYRGYRGRVVSATDTDVRMELEAQYKTVTVKKEQLKDAAGPAGYAGAAAARPSWGGGRTPMHPGATPMHPGATPLHPSATPLHPSATPMHPGSATPLHHSAWGGGQTPMHPSLDETDTGFNSSYSSSRPQGNSTPAYTGTPYRGDDYRQGKVS